MEYNKQEFAKSADRKKLHKVKKQWVVISTALLMALGGGALATHVSVHADTTNNNQGHNVDSLSNSLNKSAAPQLSVKSSAIQSKASNGSDQSSLIMNQAKSLHSQILKSGLQNSNQMKSITSSAESHHANSASASSSASQNASASSSASQSKSGSANAVRQVVKSADKLGASNTNTSNSMILKYFNQHGQQVGNTDTIPGQKAGTSINVSNPSQGGEVIPRGYKLDPGMSTNQTFTDGNQAINLELQGNQITSDNDNGENKVTVYITKNSSDGSTNNKVSDFIKGRVGDTLTVDPGSYLPNGYYANSDDHTIDVTIQPDGSLAGPKNWNNIANFGYTKDDTQLKALNKIYMHYVDAYHPQNGDIKGSTLSDADMTGTPFTSDQLKQFENLAPKGYYSLMKVLAGQQVPTKFEGHTQSITFLVAKDDDINYVDQSDGSVLKTIGLNPTQTPNNDVSYDKYSQSQYIPKGYTLVGPKGTWNSKFTSGGLNTILVRRSNQYGKITVDYVDEDKGNQIVGHASDTGKVGDPFNDNAYTTAGDIDQYTNTNSQSQTGYRYDRVLNVVSGFGQTPQTVKIGVKETHPKQPSDNTGIVTIDYKDASDQQNIGNPQKIKGTVGTPMKMYYDAFSSQNEIDENVGKGYVLAKDPNTDPNNDQKLEDEDTDTIWVKKASKPAVRSKITVNYVYNNGLVGTSSISDNSGTAFNPTQYAEAHVPSKYSFNRIISGAGISQFTDQPQQVIAAVNLKQAPVAKGTVNIHFMNNGQQVGSHSVTSDVGHSFNIKDYENTADGMPSGYEVTNVNPTINQIPKGTTDEDVILNKIPAAKGTVNIYFMYNGQRKGSYTVTSDVGHPFNIGDYENTADGMPSGYSVDSVTPNIATFTNAPQTETVNLKKNPVATGTVGIHYFINGNSAGNYFANGDVGSSFNINNYLNTADDMPSGYSVVNYTPNNITKFTNNLQNIDVNLKKNTNEVTDTIQFRHGDNNNSTLVKAIHPKGEKGQSFDVSSQVPSQYNVHSNTKFMFDGGTHVVYVGVSRPNGNQSSDMTNLTTDTIQFRHGDSNNSTLINTIQLEGKKGQSFDVSSQVPSQYNVHSNTKFTFDGGTHVVYVGVSRPNGTNVVPVTPVTPQEQGTINIYFDNNGQISGPHSVTSNVGDTFNIKNYENIADGMPANTHVTNVINNVTKFTKNSQNVYVDVAGNKMPQPMKNGIINIYFNDNGTVSGPHTITGKVGDPFNIANYENASYGMPKNTYVTDVINNVNKFTNGTRNIYVDVTSKGNPSPNPQPNQNKMGTINIYFKDNGYIYGPHAVSGVVGAPFDIADYENVADGMPANTHVTSVTFNTNHFTKGTYNVYVNVASNTPNLTPHSNTPSSSSNSSSSTPASNNVPASSSAPSSSNTPSSSSAPSSNSMPSSNSAPSSAPSSNNVPSSTPSSSDNRSATPSSDTNNNHGGGNGYNHRGNQSTPSNSGNNTDYGGNSGNGNSNNNDNNQNYSNNTFQNNNSGNGLNTSRRLAQTGEASNHDAQIAEILVMLGTTLSALGYAIDRKRRDY